MVSSEELHRNVSQETLESLVKIRGEGDNLDFKQIFSMSSKKAKAELVRDMLAFANTVGGGHLVFGVDKTYSPVGLPSIDTLPALDRQIDTTIIYQTIEKYIPTDLQFMAAEYVVQRPDWIEKRRFGILYVAQYPYIAMAKCDVSYHDGKEDIKVLKAADILIRRGAQSCHIDQTGMKDLIGRTDSFLEHKEDQVSPLDTNLPPREEVTLEFVGRREELNVLQNWFRDPSR